MRLRILLGVFALCFSSIPVLASESGIHSMIVGDKVLELADTRQLTFKSDGDMHWAAVSPDGRYVAYGEYAGSLLKIHIASARGGSVRSLDLRAVSSGSTSDNPAEWLGYGRGVWSPDSRTLVVTARYLAPDSQSASNDLPITARNTRVFIVQTDGKLAASYDLPRQASECEVIPKSIVFSPDSKRLALSVHSVDIQTLESTNRIDILSVMSGQSTSLCSADRAYSPKVLSWAKDGYSLLYDDNGSLMRASLPAGAPEKLRVCDRDDPVEISYSFDGKYAVYRGDRSGVTVKSLETGKDTPVAESAGAEFERWFSNGDLLLYAIPQTIKDDPGKRTRELRTLWLASVSGHGDHSMCVALDADADSASFSSDYRRMSYTLNCRVYLAELEWRSPTPDEKLDAGLKLTEEDEKTILLRNGKQIGSALKMYCTDWDGAFPASDSYEEGLKDYIRGGNLFARPGTDTRIFKYLGGGLTDPNIEDPSTTIVGELDAGYSWKVVIYADGHVKAVRK